jgi:hypothetical protein
MFMLFIDILSNYCVTLDYIYIFLFNLLNVVISVLQCFCVYLFKTKI